MHLLPRRLDRHAASVPIGICLTKLSPFADTTCCVVFAGLHKVAHLQVVGQRIFNTKCR